MGSGDTTVSTTRGEILTEKFTNFVTFCTANLPMSKEQFKDMQLAKQASAESIIFALRTNLLPHRDLVFARNLEGLKKLEANPIWSSSVALLGGATVEVQDKIWRYLELFCELCSFSEANQ